jgi:hypothetical protein
MNIIDITEQSQTRHALKEEGKAEEPQDAELHGFSRRDRNQKIINAGNERRKLMIFEFEHTDE